MNILLVTADQWRGDCLSLLGHPSARTPCIDELAGDAVAFLRHFGQATPCGPARASLHTGMYAMNHRSVSNGTPLDGHFTTMALEARRAGYDPVLFGYTDTSADPRLLPADDPRLRTYEGVLPGYRAELLLPEDAGPWLDHLARRGYGRMSIEEAYDVPIGEAARWRAEDSETGFLTDAFLAWLSRQPRREPWFAHLSYIKPHPPFVAAAPWHARVDPLGTPAPARAESLEEEAELHPWLAAHLERRFSASTPPAHAREPRDLSRERVARLRAAYYGLVAEVDHHLGRVLNALRAAELYDETLVIVTADHGEMLGDHWMLGKSGFFPQAFHVPLIIRDPRWPQAHGVRVSSLTEHVDLMPTVLATIGTTTPLQCDGVSLLPFLRGERPPAWRQAVHYEHDFRDLETTSYERRLGLAPEDCGIAVRHGHRWSYVHFAGLPALLFDNAADPHWRRNLAPEPAARAVLIEELQALLSFRMRMADRRLASCLLTPGGVIGRYDPLPPSPPTAAVPSGAGDLLG